MCGGPRGADGCHTVRSHTGKPLRSRKDLTKIAIGVGVMTAATAVSALSGSGLTSAADSAPLSANSIPMSEVLPTEQTETKDGATKANKAPTPKSDAKAKANVTPKREATAKKQPAPAREAKPKTRASRAEQTTICDRSAIAASKAGLTPEQGANAATIAAVARERGLPERAVVIALATAMQESKLENIDYGDRDSLGLFQQRPSMGWGTPAQVTDPRYSADKFYDGLVGVNNWQTLPVTVAAQEVQRSGFPDAYAQWEGMATVLSDHLTGATPPGTRCQ